MKRQMLTPAETVEVIEQLGPVFERLGAACGVLKHQHGIETTVKVNFAYGIITIRFRGKSQAEELSHV